MEPDAKPLARCRVLYLGSVPVENEAMGFDSLQTPLSLRYKENDTEGVDARLLVYDLGLQLQYVQSPGQIVWFPISTLHVCAATKCIRIINGATGQDTKKFVPVDLITPEFSECSPPIFGFITKSLNELVCHVFICKSDQAGMMLVQCCTSAFENRDVSRDVALQSSAPIPRTGGFLANAAEFATSYSLSNPGAPKAPTPMPIPARPLVEHEWEAKPDLPPGAMVVYAPQSVVSQGKEALQDYLATMGRSDNTRSPQGRNTVGHDYYRQALLERDYDPTPSPRDRSTIGHGPRRDVAYERRYARRGRRGSPPPDYDAPRRNSQDDCPLCQPSSRLSVDTETCPVCNPPRHPPPPPPVSTIPTASGIARRNPLHREEEPDLPDVDYDIDVENTPEPTYARAEPLPKLNDAMRRRADSLMDGSVHEQMILRENRGRRPDNRGGRLANFAHSRSEQAFMESISMEQRGRPMVVGHGPSNVYELNGVVGDRLFDDLQDTLGYYP